MIESMAQSLEDPHARHALIVHFPIVLGVLAIIPALALAARRFKSRPLSITCVAWAIATTIGLGLASGAGEEAYERVEASSPPLTATEHDALEQHESLGEGAWLWALPSLAFASATLIQKRPVRITAGALLIAANLTLAGFVTVAGHTGGKLVYTHGLGVPQRSTTGTENHSPQPNPDASDSEEETETAHREDHDD